MAIFGIGSHCSIYRDVDNEKAMIEQELKRLGYGDSWLRLIRSLLKNFEGLEFDFEESEPQVEILSILRGIQVDDGEDLARRQFTRKISQLEAFYYRAMKNTNDGPVLWNPLEQPLSKFVEENENVLLYHDEQPYPPKDLVRAWSTHNLHQNQRHVDIA